MPNTGFKRLAVETAISPLGSGLSTEIYVTTKRHYCTLLHHNVSRWRRIDVMEQHQEALADIAAQNITARVIEAIGRGEL